MHEQCRNVRKIHFRLTLACEGSGGRANGVEMQHNPPPARFARERGGGSANSIETPSGSLLHVREVEDARTASKRKKNPPPARFCMRGKWRRRERH